MLPGLFRSVSAWKWAAFPYLQVPLKYRVDCHACASASLLRNHFNQLPQQGRGGWSQYLRRKPPCLHWSTISHKHLCESKEIINKSVAEPFPSSYSCSPFNAGFFNIIMQASLGIQLQRKKQLIPWWHWVGAILWTPESYNNAVNYQCALWSD